MVRPQKILGPLVFVAKYLPATQAARIAALVAQSEWVNRITSLAMRVEVVFKGLDSPGLQFQVLL